jgi:hypothetical protein
LLSLLRPTLTSISIVPAPSATIRVSMALVVPIEEMDDYKVC